MPFAIHYGNNVWGVGRTVKSAHRHAETTLRVYNVLAPVVGMNKKRNPDLRVAKISREIAREIRNNNEVFGAALKYRIK